MRNAGKATPPADPTLQAFAAASPAAARNSIKKGPVPCYTAPACSEAAELHQPRFCRPQPYSGALGFQSFAIDLLKRVNLPKVLKRISFSLTNFLAKILFEIQVVFFLVHINRKLRGSKLRRRFGLTLLAIRFGLGLKSKNKPNFINFSSVNLP